MNEAGAESVAMGNSAELQNDDDVQKVAERRLRDSGNGPRRRSGEPNHDPLRTAKRAAAIAASLPAIGMAIFTITNLWFQSDAEAQDAHAAIVADQAALSREIGKERERNDKQDVVLGQINGKLDRGEILALKAERRGLKAELDGTPAGSPIRRRLERQLEEVEEDLRLRGVQ